MKKQNFIAKAAACAVFGLVIFFLVIPHGIVDSVRSPVSRAKNDMYSLSVAIKKYQTDNGCCPAWGIGEEGMNYAVGKENPAFYQPTFRRSWIREDSKAINTLTTPVAYIGQYPLDPFAKKKATFAYYSDGGQWIIWSPGFDGNYDIDPKRDWDPKIAQPSERLMLKSYDASNGTYSSGDIWRVSG